MRRKGDADMARIRERAEPFLRALFGDFFGRGLRSFIEILHREKSSRDDG